MYRGEDIGNYSFNNYSADFRKPHCKTAIPSITYLAQRLHGDWAVTVKSLSLTAHSTVTELLGFPDVQRNQYISLRHQSISLYKERKKETNKQNKNTCDYS